MFLVRLRCLSPRLPTDLENKVLLIDPWLNNPSIILDISVDSSQELIVFLANSKG
jgi:hypothetical protein